MGTFNDICNNDIVRSLAGSILIIGSLLCLWVCLYKYAVCQEKYQYKTRVESIDTTNKICNNRNELINMHV